LISLYGGFRDLAFSGNGQGRHGKETRKAGQYRDEGSMGAPIRESDESKPLEGTQPKNESSRNDLSKEASQRTSAAPRDRTPESIDPPRMLRAQRGVFEGDVAAVELRSRLAQSGAELVRTAADTVSPVAPRRSRVRPAAPGLRYSGPRYPGLRYAGFLVVAAATAGVAGYLVGGFGALDRLPSNPPPPRSPAGEINAVPAPLTPAASPEAPARDAQLPAVQKAAVDLAPGKGEAVQSPAPAPQTAAPPLAASPPPAQDPSEIAARMKIGADLVASGDFAAARTMFERVAEAGDAAGAFALAETYDPAVLRTLRLRGGVKADPVLARRWYEMARDMGSAAAAERIARLMQNSGR
jgi:hypothetical protein